MDVALLDGSFYSLDELPGRDVASVGHPLIVDSMELLAPFADRERPRIWFTHFNHSNPALDPSSPEHARIEELGFGV
ncbi:MAG: pyrroloquinoline quinone biosynthesis protein PqqB, partial [Actinobacteria bacterium]|nr:pyrroloquinoline quinone biosynthesis protein PqqB [Actinomycetota bacterium]